MLCIRQASKTPSSTNSVPSLVRLSSHIDLDLSFPFLPFSLSFSFPVFCLSVLISTSSFLALLTFPSLFIACPLLIVSLVSARDHSLLFFSWSENSASSKLPLYS
ncbi:hypothetical protein CGRA01v4_04807 [Colletotrichum graminicola]|nr:hypothetical protein CGRA01v4_04807 [Colletotrichum graminicola]